MSSSAPWVLSQVQVVAEAAATVAFALSGVIEAARKRLDAVGICVVGGLAAFGGGTIRDVLLDRRPLFWVEHVLWLWALLAICIAAMLFMRGRHLEPTERAMHWPDAVGLGLFTANGTQIALDSGMSAIVAVLFGMMTAVFGGVLRDIVCNEIPRAFSDHRPYAICSFVGGWVGTGGRSSFDVSRMVGAAGGSPGCHRTARRCRRLRLAPACVESDRFAMTALRAASCCGSGQESQARARNASARKSIRTRTLGGRCLRLA